MQGDYSVSNHFIQKLGILFLFLITGAFCVLLLQRQRAIESQLRTIDQQGLIKEPVKQEVVERVISTAQLWRPIQEKVKDTVVQIFAQIAEIDLLQPYKTPAQGASSGSGFLINDQGDIITNAHVIDQACSCWIQIPSLGKRIIDVDVIGISPDRDIALLRITKEGLALIKKELGKIPFLPLGNSDLVRRADEVLALGYPLGQQSLKSTTGVISGREQHLLQTSAAINPGNSGGPLLNATGEVIGINEANVPSAQNVGYAIPINDLKIILPDLYKFKLLRKPFLGVLFNNATEALTAFLGNPLPGGCYIVEVVVGSTLSKVGVERGDMIYAINGYPVDLYGEMTVPWSEDKISLIDYVSRLSVGEDVHLLIYRKGKRKEFKIKFNLVELPPVHKIYPSFEDIDYEVFAGMVVMQLTLNHIHILGPGATGLAQYAEIGSQKNPVLVITHIFPNSQVYRTRTLAIGSTINEVNGVKVHTLEEYRQALKKSMHTNFLTIEASDNVARASDHVFAVLLFDKVLEQEPRLAQDYKYPMSDRVKELLRAHQQEKKLQNKE